MDLNYLYLRRGKSLLMAAQATCERSRDRELPRARSSSKMRPATWHNCRYAGFLC